MNTRNWTYLSAKKLVFLKIGYDVAASAASLVLAFLARFALLYFQPSTSEIRPDLSEIYLNFFVKHVGIFVLLTVVSLSLMGFYKAIPKRENHWKPFKILGGLSVGPALWTLSIFYFFQTPDPLVFPRGVTLLAWLNVLLLLGGPRIVKHFALNQIIFEVHSHRKRKIRKILVIGGSGYIGSQLCRDLIQKGYDVRILDLFWFGKDSISDLSNHPKLDIVEGDFRNIETLVKAMNKIDAVIHLGGIVGDPACSLDDDFTIDINLTATKMLAELCKAYKVERFLFASSCSVYGASTDDELLTETSELNPVSLYAKTKIASEQVLLDTVDQNFCPTILRFATLFGLSPRPRFDLFVNLATAKAVREKKFTVFGGNQWRPFVHVKDISKAICSILEAPKDKVRAQIFNIGTEENCRTIAQAGDLVAAHVPGTEVEFLNEVDDPRNYRVSFKKLNDVIGIKLTTTLEDGVIEMREALERGKLRDFDINSPSSSNVKQTKLLLNDESGEDKRDKLLAMNPRKILDKIASNG